MLQCHEFAIENEELLDEWWVDSYANAGEDLLTWLCIDKLKVCCKDNHYGPECLPCPGYPENVCSGHGKCKVYLEDGRVWICKWRFVCNNELFTFREMERGKVVGSAAVTPGTLGICAKRVPHYISGVKIRRRRVRRVTRPAKTGAKDRVPKVSAFCFLISITKC